MELHVILTHQPSSGDIRALENKWLSLSRSQERIEDGKRLWMTHVPATQMRPLLHAKPYDIIERHPRLNHAELEDFRIGIGAEPKHITAFKSPDDSETSRMILFTLALEMMTQLRGLLQIDIKLGQYMFGLSPVYGDEFPAHLLDNYPGSVYEVAHENDECMLGLEWYVDAYWLRSWLIRFHQSLKPSDNSDFSRFASLDYG